MTGAAQPAFATPRFGTPGSVVVPLREHLVGGRTVEWELRDAERVGRAARRWANGVSFLQADHLATMGDKRRRGEVHTGFLLAAMRFDTPLDEAAMAGALTAFVRRHEELRAHYRPGPSGPERWVAPPEEFVIGVADVESVVVGDADVGSWVGRRASERARAELVPGSWWAATVDDAGFTFFAATDHAHGDGYSSVLALTEITALYRAHREGTGPEPRPADLPAPGAFGPAVLAERSAAAALAADDDRVAVWRNALADNAGRAPLCPLDLGLADATPAPAVAVEQWLLDPDALTRCDARLAATGGGFAGLLYAALAVRHREITGESRFFVSTVLATRDPDTAWTQGWMCNFAPVVVDLPDGEQATFDDVVRAGGDSVRAARRAGSAPAHGVLALLAAEGVFRGLDGSPYMVSYTDLARLPIGDDPALSTIQTSSGVGPTRNANLWFTRTPAGLVVRCHLPDNEVARASVVEHLARVGAILNDYASERTER
ncbi:acyltransferase [Gordonia sp. KTR9]|uniref:acyltransferase n=1 Tax=Gordonia sp. KTR9 TaxID=337191 RepID=UPI00027DDA63|nr:acyltransferase [Gordonia sp. KTR9]AFR47520.1 Non-ribosomal peptide synthetase modules-related protein [Gordonia sp. KTR9]